MFLDKRIYQGSSGRVYPHPVIDKIEDEKKLKTYRMAILENDYLRIEIMPELGGRVYRAVDKTNNYDFVYYNQVIKPDSRRTGGAVGFPEASSSTGHSITARTRTDP